MVGAGVGCSGGHGPDRREAPSPGSHLHRIHSGACPRAGEPSARRAGNRAVFDQVGILATDKVPVECIEMSDVKNDAVSFRNRPVIENLRPRDAKDRVGIVAGLSQAIEEVNPASSKIGFALASFSSTLLEWPFRAQQKIGMRPSSPGTRFLCRQSAEA